MKAFGIAFVLYFMALIAGVIGWIINLVDVVSGFIHHVPFTTEFVLRIIGIPVAILGAILGWM